MTHRADQIVDKVVALIKAQCETDGYHVFKHRRRSLADASDQLPAFSVDFGDDEVADDLDNVNITSRLNVRVSCLAQEVGEPALMERLLKMRTEVEIALEADHTLGLAWVTVCEYDGADAPIVNVDGTYLAGSLTSSWQVLYRMPRGNPE